ncbi:MAG TPA: hypothetical protein VGL34_02130 [Steroidobacteraceae bacterium]|jgi:hypothetical protein
MPETRFDDLLPALKTVSHMTIRRHTLAMGCELEAHRLEVADGQVVQGSGAAKSLVVGIDDTL